MGKNTGKIAVGTILAAAAGYVAGLLTAPKSGRETRKDLQKAASKALTEGERQLKKLHSELASLIDKAGRKTKNLKGKARTELTAKLRAASTAKEKARAILTALHDGDADDAELRTALAEAKLARDHLKAFLKK